MATHTAQPLRRVFRFYELTFFGLVAVTGALGGLWAYFWQQTSTESLRLNSLTHVMQEIRTTVAQQIQDVALARLRQDPQVEDIHGRYYRQVQAGFNALRRNSGSRREDYAIQSMQEAYGRLQDDLHAALEDPAFLTRILRFRAFDSRSEEKSLLGGFEAACGEFRVLVDSQLAAREARIAQWNRYAPWLLPVPLLLALLLLFLSRRSLTRGFVRPMQDILEGTERMSRGELSHRLPVEGAQEVAHLAESVNHLATDLAASRDALVESERQAALGALVPVVAHNIRNPLAAIRASAQLMTHVDDPAEAREVTDNIISTVDRLGRWVSALVSYLHPLKPRPRVMQATALLDAVVHLCQSRLQEKHLRIECEPWDTAVRVEVDSDLMEQALYGLLGNAVEASPVGAWLRLSVFNEDGEARLVLEDEAGGMPFEPQPGGLEPGPSTKRFGTGLGIPVAFKVCKAHGWVLTFHSTAGVGTRIVLAAPRVTET